MASSLSSAPLMLSVSGARGIVGASMTPIVSGEIAAAFGSFLRGGLAKRPTILLARDGRPSGEMLGAAATAGLLAIGCDVIDLGVVMTPTVGVMIDVLGADGGVVITASHNPIEWNGLKCLDQDGLAPPPAKASEIIDRFRSKRFSWADAESMGVVRHDDRGVAKHLERVLRLVDVDRIRARRFTVVLDSVNGAGCVAGRMLLERLGCEVIHLNGEPTGRFAHTPEPIEANLTDLCAVVASRHGSASPAVVGFAQDPDADRLAVIDETGRYIGEEYTLVLAAKRALDRHGPGALAANLSTSRMIDDLAARYPGATVLRSAVGEANVVAAMKSAGALLGGEGNGGVIVPSVCWIRDSLSAMAMVLDLLAAESIPLSALVASLPRYEMIKHKFELAEVGGVEAIKPALARVERAFADCRVNSSDGVRIDFADGWVHLRPSNTEPIVRLIAEAGTRERVWELIDEVAVAAGLR